MANRRTLPAPLHTDEQHFKPMDLERRYGINSVTRWRWEKKGTIPPRDVFRDGEPWGWTQATILASERRSATS